MQIMISSITITEIQRLYSMHAIHTKVNKKVLTFALLTRWRMIKYAQQCLLHFLWCGCHFGTCKSLGSSPLKMSQAFHDPYICLPPKG